MKSEKVITVSLSEAEVREFLAIFDPESGGVRIMDLCSRPAVRALLKLAAALRGVLDEN